MPKFIFEVISKSNWQLLASRYGDDFENYVNFGNHVIEMSYDSQTQTIQPTERNQNMDYPDQPLCLSEEFYLIRFAGNDGLCSYYGVEEYVERVNRVLLMPHPNFGRSYAGGFSWSRSSRRVDKSCGLCYYRNELCGFQFQPAVRLVDEVDPRFNLEYYRMNGKKFYTREACEVEAKCLERQERLKEAAVNKYMMITGLFEDVARIFVEFSNNLDCYLVVNPENVSSDAPIVSRILEHQYQDHSQLFYAKWLLNNEFDVDYSLQVLLSDDFNVYV